MLYDITTPKVLVLCLGAAALCVLFFDVELLRSQKGASTSETRTEFELLLERKVDQYMNLTSQRLDALQQRIEVVQAPVEQGGTGFTRDTAHTDSPGRTVPHERATAGSLTDEPHTVLIMSDNHEPPGGSGNVGRPTHYILSSMLTRMYAAANPGTALVIYVVRQGCLLVQREGEQYELHGTWTKVLALAQASYDPDPDHDLDHDLDLNLDPGPS